MVALVSLGGSPSPTGGPTGPEEGPLREQSWLIPSPISGVMMSAELFRPEGNGPFRLAIVAHGSEEDARARARAPMPSFPALTSFLVAHGFAVLIPVRPGQSPTGGPYLESQGWCGSPDYIKAGLGTSKSIESALTFMKGQSFVRSSGMVVIGNSAGGWGAIALASLNPPELAAVVSFAGGRGGREGNRADTNCAEDRLIAAAGAFGRTARVPSLWLYAENDSYFGPKLSKAMADAFVGAGGRAEYRLYPPLARDGHFLIQQDPSGSWGPALAAFLKSH